MSVSFSSVTIADNSVGTSALVAGSVTPVKIAIQSVTALADAAATLTAAEMIAGLFTITPTAGRALTTDTAANIVAAISGAEVGTWFDLTIVCLAAFAATLTAGSGVTIVGTAAVNNQAGTFKVLLTDVTSGSEAVTIYRMTD